MQNAVTWIERLIWNFPCLSNKYKILCLFEGNLQSKSKDVVQRSQNVITLLLSFGNKWRSEKKGWDYNCTYCKYLKKKNATIWNRHITGKIFRELAADKQQYLSDINITNDQQRLKPPDSIPFARKRSSWRTAIAFNIKREASSKL